MPVQRKLVWISRSSKDFARFPDEVQRRFRLSLKLVQSGGRKMPGAKALSRGILKRLGIAELVEDFQGDTYRVVYTVKFEAVVALLDAFKKKSTSGIATPHHEIRLIRDRYRTAKRLYGKATGGDDGQRRRPADRRWR